MNTSPSQNSKWCSGREKSHEMATRGHLKKDKKQNDGIYTIYMAHVMSRYKSKGGDNAKALREAIVNKIP